MNALFLDLSDGRHLDLVRKITFPFRDPQHLEIPDGAETQVFIEVGFGDNSYGFGWPDAIICVTFADKKLVIFIEAKAGLYVHAAKDFTSRQDGFNSSINGQLTLRYRLAQALRTHKKDSARLREPEGLTLAYGENTPRRLAKPENLRLIVEPFVARASEYLFVAMTDDSLNVWPMVQEKNPRLLPFICDPGYSDCAEPANWSEMRNSWNKHREAFGWIGFQDIEPMVKGGEYFLHAVHFLEAKRKGRAPNPDSGVFRAFHPKRKWETFAIPTLTLRERIKSLLDVILHETNLRYDRGDGSDSVIGPDQRRLLKILPTVGGNEEAAIFLGAKVETSGFPEAVRNRIKEIVTVRKRAFEILPVRHGEYQDSELKELLVDTISRVQEESETR
ncbi:MAG: hypothetical protein EXS09_22000 [Gemmataceae bacterium]|nr:hypothetical protein [Gemmataceae bacterium]